MGWVVIGWLVNWLCEWVYGGCTYSDRLNSQRNPTLSSRASSLTAHVRQYWRSRGPRPPASRSDLRYSGFIVLLLGGHGMSIPTEVKW